MEPTSSSEATATWEPVLPSAGNYEVFARWTASADRATAVKYQVKHDGDKYTEVEKNQRNNGGKWASLGRYYQQEDGDEGHGHGHGRRDRDDRHEHDDD